VMVVASTGATLAAKNATGTIPLVFVGPSDPVSLGIVASFAKPGANITGLTLGGPELYGKRLELLAETIPGLSRLVFLREPANPSADLALKQMAAPAQNLGLLIQSFEVRTANDIQTAFKEAVKTQAGATIVGPYPPISTQRKLVIDLAIKNRIPAMYGDRQWPDAGGLMSYGVNTSDLYRRAAYYVDKILKGTKPGDLPVEQPTKFELVINLKTAKQIGLTIPQSVLYRAD